MTWGTSPWSFYMADPLSHLRSPGTFGPLELRDRPPTSRLLRWRKAGGQNDHEEYMYSGACLRSLRYLEPNARLPRSTSFVVQVAPSAIRRRLAQLSTSSKLPLSAALA